MRHTLLLAALLPACAPESQNLLTAGAFDDAFEPAELPTEQAPPMPYALDLWSSPWIAGATTQVLIRGATPGGTVRLMLGSPGTICPPPLGGTCADIAGAIIPLGSAVADGRGQATIAVNVPGTAPIGAHRRMQAFGDLGGGPARASNPWDGEVVASCPGPSGCNLLANPELNTDASGWRPVPGNQEIRWSSTDRTGLARSGSLEVVARMIGVYSSPWQCVPVQPGQTFDYRAWGMLPAGTHSVTMFGEYIFYTGDDCSGGLTGFAETSRGVGNVPGVWTELALRGFVAPAGSGSVRVGHGVIDTGFGNATAIFDDYELIRR